MLFYQISDAHLTGNAARIEYRKNNEYFKRIADWFLRRAHLTKKTPPLLFCGDVLDTPSQSSFDIAKELLAPLHEAGYPLHFVPGNHDLSHLGISWDSSGEFTRRWNDLVTHFGDSEEYPTEHVHGDTVIFGVDSSSNPTSFARGEVGNDQISRLKARLDYYKNWGKRLVVFVHHHPFDRNFTLAMVDYGSFMQTVYSRADVLLFGHKHQYAVWDTPEKMRTIKSMPKSICEQLEAKSPEVRLKLMVSAGRCTSASKGFLNVLGYQTTPEGGTRLVPIRIFAGG
jgi:3',5'-cyclic AMP phosphodiesterase CpdA